MRGFQTPRQSRFKAHKTSANPYEQSASYIYAGNTVSDLCFFSLGTCTPPKAQDVGSPQPGPAFRCEMSLGVCGLGLYPTPLTAARIVAQEQFCRLARAHFWGRTTTRTPPISKQASALDSSRYTTTLNPPHHGLVLTGTPESAGINRHVVLRSSGLPTRRRPQAWIAISVARGAGYPWHIGSSPLDELNKLAWEQTKVTGTATGDTIAVKSVTAAAK